MFLLLSIPYTIPCRSSSFLFSLRVFSPFYWNHGVLSVMTFSYFRWKKRWKKTCMRFYEKFNNKKRVPKFKLQNSLPFLSFFTSMMTKTLSTANAWWSQWNGKHSEKSGDWKDHYWRLWYFVGCQSSFCSSGKCSSNINFERTSSIKRIQRIFSWRRQRITSTMFSLL